MGVIKSGILGGFSGKVGGVIGSSWKGIATIKAMPQSVYNPKTNAQVANRDRFTFIRNLAADCLTTIVKPLNDRFAQRMSGYNLFCSRNKYAYNEAFGFVPDQLKISAGKLGDSAITTLDIDVTGGVMVSWTPTPQGNYESVDDIAYILVLDSNGKVVETLSAESRRSNGAVTLPPVVGIFAGSTYNVYLTFLRSDGSMVANSDFKQAVAHN